MVGLGPSWIRVVLEISDEFGQERSSYNCWVKMGFDTKFRQMKPATFALVLDEDAPELPLKFDEGEVWFLDRDGEKFDAVSMQECLTRVKTQWAPNDPRRVSVCGTAYHRGLGAPELRRLFWMGSGMPELSWVGLSPRYKRSWLKLARYRTWVRGVRSGTGSGVLDMTLVDSVESLYCGLGEAMRGPGGNVGVDLDDAEYLVSRDDHPICHLAHFEAWKAPQKTPDLPWRIEQLSQFITLEYGA